jgi:hypothetical protein
MEKETGKKCETDIVTWRGMMTKVCSMAAMLMVSMDSGIYADCDI